MTDTWTTRDLPVLKAAVELFEQKGRGPRASAIATEVGLDEETVQRALSALYREPYFEKGLEGDDQITARVQHRWRLLPQKPLQEHAVLPKGRVPHVANQDGGQGFRVR